ncbi:MAG: DUF354 domain-containing protein [Firmicutes bacterium]|nr:DUF354 domain-containing protein [Bacillota bacterium]
MRYIIAVNHPAQYHLFKNVYFNLKQRGHDAIFVVRDKDILMSLMESDNVEFILLLKKRIGNSKLSILFKGAIDILHQGFVLFKFALKFKPDVMFGTDYSITHVGFLLNIKTIVFNEDDYSINKLFCKLSYPFADCIVAPSICNVHKYEYKRIGYNGYQKLTYLHPAVFHPNVNIKKKYINDEKYFLIRLVRLSAGHDIEMNHKGISVEVLKQLISILEKYGRVYISSESTLPLELYNYVLNIDFKDIHHLMAYASLVIADSQSMVVEACMLGTPSIRFNSFVGKISVLEELQNYYELTYGIHSDQPAQLFSTIESLLRSRDYRSLFISRRDKMLSEKINVYAFFNWFIENYPISKQMMQDNPGLQYNFK